MWFDHLWPKMMMMLFLLHLPDFGLGQPKNMVSFDFLPLKYKQNQTLFILYSISYCRRFHTNGRVRLCKYYSGKYITFTFFTKIFHNISYEMFCPSVWRRRSRILLIYQLFTIHFWTHRWVTLFSMTHFSK